MEWLIFSILLRIFENALTLQALTILYTNIMIEMYLKIGKHGLYELRTYTYIEIVYSYFYVGFVVHVL